MSRTLVDIDDALLVEAMDALDVTTKRAAISQSLETVVRMKRAREHLRHLKDGMAQDLEDDSVVEAAQR